MLANIARAEEALLGFVLRSPALLSEPSVSEALVNFLSPATAAAANAILESGTAVPALLVDRVNDPAVGGLVSRLSSLDAPMDDRPPLELFRLGAWQLGRMRLEREIRALSREMAEREREGELPADMLQRKVTLTRELEKYKGMGDAQAPARSH